MKMKKIVSILAMLIITLSLLTQTVKAAGFNFIVSPSATTVNYGDTVTITLKVADIDAGELGINTVEWMLNYDQEMFEDVKVESRNNWSITYNDREGNQNKGKVLAVLIGTGITQDQEIGAISFKVKKNITAKSGNITFTQVTSNDGQNLIPTSDKTVTINIKDNSSENNNNNNGNKVDVNTTIDIDNDKNKNNNNNKQTSTNKTTISSNNSNMSSKPIPQTGDDLFLIVLCIVGMGAISISAYIEYRRCKKK